MDKSKYGTKFDIVLECNKCGRRRVKYKDVSKRKSGYNVSVPEYCIYCRVEDERKNKQEEK